MKTKKWLFVVIALLLIVGVGGKVYMDKQKEQEMKNQLEIETNKIEAERMSVVALKDTFVNIKSVEFEHTGYNEMTGYYSMVVKMTNIEGDFVKFDYEFATNHPNEISSWGVIDEENIQKAGKTKGKVKVKYSNGSESEV